MNVLLSYAYFGKADLDTFVADTFGAEWDGQLMADSGAFSASSLGIDVTVDGYTAWLHRNQHRLDVYANLDVIRQPRKTAANQSKMERAGLHPIPVFHAGTDYRVLKRLVAEYDYIALGSLLRSAGMDQLYRHLVQCFRIAGDGARFHGFGLTDWKALLDFDWKSVDSSSWGRGHRYGILPIWTGRRMSVVRLKDRQRLRRYAGQLEQLGVDWRTFDGSHHYHEVAGAAAASTALAEDQLRAAGRDITIYMVDGSASNLKAGWRGVQRYRQTKEATA